MHAYAHRKVDHIILVHRLHNSSTVAVVFAYSGTKYWKARRSTAPLIWSLDRGKEMKERWTDKKAMNMYGSLKKIIMIYLPCTHASLFLWEKGDTLENVWFLACTCTFTLVATWEENRGNVLTIKVYYWWSIGQVVVSVVWMLIKADKKEKGNKSVFSSTTARPLVLQ